MKIIVFGGDGFCGWPTALHLSNLGHDILIVDNFSRRKIDIELGIESLTPIYSIYDRIKAWKEVSGKEIQFRMLDIAQNYEGLLQVLLEYRPDAVIHFAEQRSAPYSMKNSDTKRYTVDNNINATHNILVAITSSGLNVHLIHLGTMGVYGYTSHGMVIPEGYLPVEIQAGDTKITQEILYPADPGSVYHTTKTLDQLLFYYYAKNDKLRITDLHQGIVWGTQTKETALDERLINRFDYDGDYGTVLNRFLLQAVLKYPLSVHGTGGQTRGFIHIQDSVKCLQLSVENPPQNGERVCIRNQISETHRVRDLAQIVSKLTGAEIAYIANPRNEDKENDLDVSNACFLKLGLTPHKLETSLLTEIKDIAEKYKDRCEISKIPCYSYWNKEIADKISK